MRVLILDADNALGTSVAQAFAGAGHQVVMHARAPWEAHALSNEIEFLEAKDPVRHVAQWDEDGRSVQCVIFNLKPQDEIGLLGDNYDAEPLIGHLTAELRLFLAEMQALVGVLTRAGHGLVWVMVQEDSGGYYLPTPVASVSSRAKIATVKSIAKETARFGIKVNAISVQTYREQAPTLAWQAAREDLGSYALKFKAIDAQSIADTLVRLSESPNLPIVGMVIPFGIAMPDYNI